MSSTRRIRRISITNFPYAQALRQMCKIAEGVLQSGRCVTAVFAVKSALNRRVAVCGFNWSRNERCDSGRWHRKPDAAADQGDQQAPAADLQQADDLLPAGMHGQGGD